MTVVKLPLFSYFLANLSIFTVKENRARISDEICAPRWGSELTGLVDQSVQNGPQDPQVRSSKFTVLSSRIPG